MPWLVAAAIYLLLMALVGRPRREPKASDNLHAMASGSHPESSIEKRGRLPSLKRKHLRLRVSNSLSNR